ncbi:MAG: dihydrolipoyl dehydrogenase [Candidatus Kariarchaeaceae archaeon]|jgi:dihydrolipoamide dehydrogenase
MNKSVDVVVIGAGPGGYPAAIRAAQLGKSVIIVEKGYIGGECLNWGCIPSKALISASKFYHKINHKAEEMGIHVTSTSIDIGKMQEWKESVQDRLIGGIKQLLKANKVETIMGTAKFVSKGQIEINLLDGDTLAVSYTDVIIATGAKFISLPGFEIDEHKILSAKGALALREIPKDLVCIGGGIIGLELGMVWAKLGSKVTIVELLPNILNTVEKRMVNILKKKLKSLGVDILTESKATSLDKSGKRMKLEVETKDGVEVLKADKILLSIGKRAITEDLGLEILGVKADQRGFIEINSKMQTNISNVYAIGDCTGEPFLAHRATKQGTMAAEVIAGLSVDGDWRAMPGAIFTDPEIAFVGLSEDEAKAEGYEVHVGQASFGASGRAMSQLEDEGFVRMIADGSNGVVLGVEIVGPNASDLISEAALALEMGATVEDIGFTIHPHPTLPEMLMEAAEAIEGKAIHVPNRRVKKKK